MDAERGEETGYRRRDGGYKGCAQARSCGNWESHAAFVLGRLGVIRRMELKRTSCDILFSLLVDAKLPILRKVV